MKHILSIIVLLFLVSVVQLSAQQNPQLKDKNKSNHPTGNPGDPRNAEKGRDNANSNNQDAAEDEREENEGLLGDDNREADPAESGNNSSSYRNNRASGAPNNRDIEGGSNREADSDNETDESSVSDGGADTTAMSEDPGQKNQGTGAGVIMDESTSGSGSPAMRQEGSERDGTNNVQRAKPNMAGARVDGIRPGRKSVDSDREIRAGSQRQQQGNEGPSDQAMGSQNGNTNGQQSSGTQPSNASGTNSIEKRVGDQKADNANPISSDKKDTKSNRKKKKNRD